MYNHIAQKVGKEVQKRIDALKIAQKMQDLPKYLWHKSFKYYLKEDKTRNCGPNLRIVRLDPLKPALTVTGYIFNKFVHPFENRYISVREAARLQDFPDDFEFKWCLTSTQKQVGNAVPISLSKAIFNQICKYSDLKGRKITALSLFSGAGGQDIGVSKAIYNNIEINTLLSIDMWKDACDSLKSYFLDLNVVEANIHDIKDPVEFWKKNTSNLSLPDLVYGGPPCQSFSQAGKQTGFKDLRGSLVLDFIRFVKHLNPSYFVMENVSNIKSIDRGKLVNYIFEKFKELDYKVNFKILCAADFGAPQLRKRAIFMGAKNTHPEIPFPSPTHIDEKSLLNLKPYRTVQEAFNGLPPICL